MQKSQGVAGGSYESVNKISIPLLNDFEKPKQTKKGINWAAVNAAKKLPPKILRRHTDAAVPKAMSSTNVFRISGETVRACMSFEKKIYVVNLIGNAKDFPAIDLRVHMSMHTHILYLCIMRIHVQIVNFLRSLLGMQQ